MTVFRRLPLSCFSGSLSNQVSVHFSSMCCLHIMSVCLSVCTNTCAKSNAWHVQAHYIVYVCLRELAESAALFCAGDRGQCGADVLQRAQQ